MPNPILPENNNSNSNSGFVKKSIETPILDSAVRNRLSDHQAAVLTESGFKGFYNANKFYFWAIFAGIFIIALLSFLAFRKPATVVPKEAKVNVVIEAPETAPSGGELLYTVKIENQDSQKLVGLTLELGYVDGITFVDSAPMKPDNITGTVFKIPDITPGLTVPVKIKVKISGNVNDTKQLIAKLHYKYSNFNSEFVKENSFSVRLAASNVALDITGPSTTNNAQLVVYQIKYQNNSGSDIKNARIQLTYPDGFSFDSANPPADLSNNIWNLNSLANNGQGTIEIQGTYKSSGAGESKILVADFLVLGQDGQYFTQGSNNITTVIATLPLLVEQELSPVSETNVINPGDNLNFQIKYQNNASTAASGVNIIVTLNSKSLDMSTLSAEGGQISGSTILWNASSIAALDNLNPSESGQLSFRVSVKKPATKDSSKNLTVVSSIKIKSNEYSTYFPGNDLSLKISSPAQMTSALSFVSGSLPPQVGKITVYKVKLSLLNSSNDFSDVSVTANIPLGSGGFVDGSVSPAEINKTQFDSSTGKLTWNVGLLSAHSGDFSQARSLEFNVRLNPASNQVNQTPALVQNIQLTAKDIFTGQTVSVSSDDISTQDVSGNNSYNQGQVQP